MLNKLLNYQIVITVEIAGLVPPHTILSILVVTVLLQHENVFFFYVFFYRGVEHACLKPYVPYRLSTI
jgi:hypothetical protein